MQLLLGEAYAKISRMPRARQFDGSLIAYAGLTMSKFNLLSADHKEDLRLGSLWMSRQFDPRMIDRPVVD